MNVSEKQFFSQPPIQYFIAIAAVALALSLSLILWHWIDPHSTTIFIAAIALIAWYGGLGPSLLAIGLSAILIDYYFIPPIKYLEFSIDNIVRTIVFVLVALVISWIDNARRRALDERNQMLSREKEARKEAENANRAKDDFIAMVAHELRAPLGVMLGWSRMLRENNIDKETLHIALETIERNAKLQKQLIDDLMDISRIVTGNLHFNVKSVDLTEVINAAIEVVKMAANAKGIQIKTEYDKGVGRVNGDPARLQQVVWNLLSNAIKFTPEGGSVEINLYQTDSGIKLVVKDNGQGISREFLPFVFDRFRQARIDEYKKQSGLGLGLAIVKQLIEMHGGQINVESEGEGHGTTFTLILPATEHDTNKLREELRPGYYGQQFSIEEKV
jgi:signal transduction histidine kinase